MNLQELLKERERIDKELEKYNEEMKKLKDLYYWQDVMEKSFNIPLPLTSLGGLDIIVPDHIRDLFLNALQAEIDKIENNPE